LEFGFWLRLGRSTSDIVANRTAVCNQGHDALARPRQTVSEMLGE
jgi:hypothetical protein